MNAVAFLAEPHPPRPDRIVLAAGHHRTGVVVSWIGDAVHNSELPDRAGIVRCSHCDRESGDDVSVLHHRELAIRDADQYQPAGNRLAGGPRVLRCDRIHDCETQQSKKNQRFGFDRPAGVVHLSPRLKQRTFPEGSRTAKLYLVENATLGLVLRGSSRGPAATVCPDAHTTDAEETIIERTKEREARGSGCSPRRFVSGHRFSDAATSENTSGF